GRDGETLWVVLVAEVARHRARPLPTPEVQIQHLVVLKLEQVVQRRAPPAPVRAVEDGAALPVKPVDRVDQAAGLHPSRPVDPKLTCGRLPSDEARPTLFVVPEAL